MNFTQLILFLYRNDLITFDADGSCNVSACAIWQIEKLTAPMPFVMSEFEKTFAYQVIKKQHQSVPRKEEGEERVVTLAEVTRPDQLKEALLFNHNRLVRTFH